jgi:hypothetical protein
MANGHEAVAMNSRARGRLRRDLDELVGPRLEVATFCAEAGPQHLRHIFAKVAAAGGGVLVASQLFERGE